MLLIKYSLSQALARQVAFKAEEAALGLSLAVSIAVVNEAGLLVHFTKMDNSSNICGSIAIAKAQHAVNYQRNTKYHEDFLKQGQLRVLALPGTLGHRRWCAITVQRYISWRHWR